MSLEAQSNSPDLPDNDRHFAVSAGVANAFFFRGMKQEDQGFIFQPGIKYMTSHIGNDSLGVGAYAQSWNSLHSQDTYVGSDSIIDSWYWSEAEVGLDWRLYLMNLTTSYVFYFSPNDAFDTVQEIKIYGELGEGWDFGPFSLAPFGTLAFDTSADGFDARDKFNSIDENEKGIFAELGVAPGISFGDQWEFAFRFPLSFGFSVKDYYQDSNGDDSPFGYTKIGGEASVPIPFPSSFGKWSIRGGLYGYLLGTQTESINDGNDTAFVGKLGIRAEF